MSPRPRHLQVRAASGEGRRCAAVVFVVHDISEIRKSNEVRRDFVDNVSHEFKTPLTAIQGFAETLIGGALEDTKNAVAFSRSFGITPCRLAQLTNELLKLSQIETGKLELTNAALAMPDLIDACLETARVQSGAQGGHSCEPAVRRIAAGSTVTAIGYGRFFRIFSTTPSSTRRQAAVSPWRPTRSMARSPCSINDTGIGILHDEQERIFERFYRTEVARSLETGGTGLGLAIAKHLMEAHGGRIEVESAVGRGSTFTIYLSKSVEGESS